MYVVGGGNGVGRGVGVVDGTKTEGDCVVEGGEGSEGESGVEVEGDEESGGGDGGGGDGGGGLKSKISTEFNIPKLPAPPPKNALF
jgi:hypothetical protein